MKPILEVRGIGKQYKIGGEKQRYLSVRDQLVSGFKNIVPKKASKKEENTFWALKDITFDVYPGESIGIIGRNGAGKSTLLKILSKITPPTEGYIKARGRVASLLEVGTGFHPELSGRENIYLNGSILGLRRWEINKKFDEIVDFSGVEKFLDTPLKHYSSGMQLRLAFAVAAHLEPEILVIDEVLAVGDAEFQKKCLGKMDEVSKSGRTILFVSHNMGAVKSLCGRGVLLDYGKLIEKGNTENVVNLYLNVELASSSQKKFGKEYDKKEFILHEISINPKNEDCSKKLDEFQEILLNTSVTIKKEAHRYHLVYVLKNGNGETIFTTSHLRINVKLKEGLNRLKCIFPSGFLNIGNYFLDIYFIQDKKVTIFVEKDIFSFKVFIGSRPLGAWMGKEPGFIKPRLKWHNN